MILDAQTATGSGGRVLVGDASGELGAGGNSGGGGSGSKRDRTCLAEGEHAPADTESVVIELPSVRVVPNLCGTKEWLKKIRSTQHSRVC